MAAWTCKCGKLNPLRISECSCGKTIPRAEIRRIANLELKLHVEEARRERSIKKTAFYQKLNVFLGLWLQLVMTGLTIVFFVVVVIMNNEDVSFYTDRACEAVEQTLDTASNINKVGERAWDKFSSSVGEGLDLIDEKLEQVNTLERAADEKLSLVPKTIGVMFERIYMLRKEIWK